MAEKTILVCDACGKPATETVTIKVERGNFVKDLCGTHVNELVAGARKPRPGRRKGSVASTTRAAAPAPRKTTARKTTARKTRARKPTARKRGRPRKKVAA
jgi:hypothetical protein